MTNDIRTRAFKGISLSTIRIHHHANLHWPWHLDFHPAAPSCAHAGSDALTLTQASYSQPESGGITTAVSSEKLPRFGETDPTCHTDTFGLG